MITSISDLNNRTFVESNTLKSFILSNSSGDNTSIQSRNDILIHDYQLANSITINTIVSNFMVGVRKAVELIEQNPSSTISYFQITKHSSDYSVEDENDSLEDQVKLFLSIDTDDYTCSFKSRQLKLVAHDIDNPDGVDRFVNIDNIWYGIARMSNGDLYDQMEMVGGLNSSLANSRFGEINPFYETSGCSFTVLDENGNTVSSYTSFNNFLMETNSTISCIVENRFKNALDDIKSDDRIKLLTKFDYIMCLSTGLFGMVVLTDDDKNFKGFSIYDFGKMISNFSTEDLNSSYQFCDCSFNTVDETTTLFIVVCDRNIRSGKNRKEYYYIYLNDDSFDTLYGLHQINILNNDGYVLEPKNVFNFVNSFNQLGTVSVAMTDYGFWDIEPNETNDIIYSYRGDKTYNENTAQQFSSRTDKILEPFTDISQTQRICDYDKVWGTSGDYYWCLNVKDTDGNQIKYPISIDGHSFFGGTEAFGVYDKNGDDNVKLMVGIYYDLFTSMLFTDDSLSNIVIVWLYDCVSQQNKGKYYLKKYHSYFARKLNSLKRNITFKELDYSLGSSLVPAKFQGSVLDLAKCDNTNGDTLSGYCTNLYKFVSNTSDDLWKYNFDDSAIINTILSNFKSNEWETKYLTDVVNDCVDGLVDDSDGFPMLGYFRQYLKQHIYDDFKTIKYNTIQLDEDVAKGVIQDIQKYLKTKTYASMVLGGYDSTKTGNDAYPGMSNYISDNKVELGKSDVQNVFSVLTIKNETIDALKSTKFFGEYNTYSEMKLGYTDSDIFTITKNGKFAQLSGLVDDSYDVMVDWGEVQNWLMSDDHTQEKILKAFVRTQVYRNLYFKSDNYTSFSSDEDKYKCSTLKFYEKHDGTTNQLKFYNGQVNASESNLGDSDIHNIKYIESVNKLQYEIHSDETTIVDDRFVYNDTEYYVVRDKSNSNQISSIYFNERINGGNRVTGSISIDDNGKFTLDGVEYTITEDNIITIDEFQSFESEFSQQIVDNRFSINGVQYVIDGKKVKYEATSEKKLVELQIAHTGDYGYGWYNTELQFVFSSNDTVKVIRHYSSDISDKLYSEWCSFDDREIDISERYGRTFDLYVGYELDALRKDPTLSGVVSLLGDGNLYDGELTTSCSIYLKHEVQNGVVVSKCVAKKQDGTEIDIGVLFDGSKISDTVSDKTFVGNISGIGILTIDDGGQYVFVRKDITGTRTILDAIWIDKDKWSYNVGTESCGTCSVNNDVITVSFSDGSKSILTPNSGKTSYSVQFSKHGSSFTYDVNSGTVIGIFDNDGNRYELNTTSGTVNRLIFNQMEGYVFDFSTQYGYEQLLDNMLYNTKQFMLNYIVQHMIDNGNETSIGISPSVAPNLYLDMFSDYSSLKTYSTSNNVDIDSEQSLKYAQIFKNNIQDVDTSSASSGRMYTHFTDVIDTVFGESQKISVVDTPSMSVERDGGIDSFTYSVNIDLYISANNKFLKDRYSDFNGKYIVGNVVVKDIVCSVTFVPRFNAESDMTYDVTYRIESNSNSTAEYSSIIYNYGNKTKSKVVSDCESVSFNLIGWDYTETNKDISDMMDELVSNRISDEDNPLFTQSSIQQILMDVNNAISDQTGVRVSRSSSGTLVQHANISSVSDLNSYATFNGTSTVKSINTPYTEDKWLDILDETVTESMKSDVVDMVKSILKKDDEYFQKSTAQLQSFLESVDSELKQSINREDLLSMCKFNYSIVLNFKDYSQSEEYNGEDGLFHVSDELYSDGLTQLNEHMRNQFFTDFSSLSVQVDETSFKTRDYYPIMNSSFDAVCSARDIKLKELFGFVGKVKDSNDAICKMFDKYGKDSDVRFMNVIDTSISQELVSMYVIDGTCNIFAKEDGVIYWYQISSNSQYAWKLIQEKASNLFGGYVFYPTSKTLDLFTINPSMKNDGFFRFANRDLTSSATSISDAFILRCVSETDSDLDLWYLSYCDCYLYSEETILDVAYEQYSDSLFVILDGDNHLYRYVGVKSLKDSTGKVILNKNDATMKIDTYHSHIITDRSSNSLKWIYLDYEDGNGEDGVDWSISVYGELDGVSDVEVWGGNPCSKSSMFKQNNTIVFGTSLLNDNQMVFQNISKNKDMFTLLDINEVDGNYYGLFRDDDNSTEQSRYAVFKTPIEEDDVVQRLPNKVLVPQFFRTGDDLYSLYVVDEVDGKVQLSEISVPNSDPYTYRKIDLQGIFDADKIDTTDFQVNTVLMSSFQLQKYGSYFLVLSNKGFHEIVYENDINQLSIDTVDSFNEYLKDMMEDIIFKKHMDEIHDGTQADYFAEIKKKINQFSDTFSVYDLIPTEFSQTQIVGVVPDSKIDDDDESEDHRVDSIQASTDIFVTDGLVVGTDNNPGIITAAIANPATVYDDETVFLKSQRNPSIANTEFYDYIYDSSGNTIADLYAISFIYKVHTNNTYDLYINIPTTRTKYLNRFPGTLKDDLTTQVLSDDTRTRVNFLDEKLSNNLDESTTKLRIYIDRKFISIGNVELVEICGNSIPTQIYRDDGANDSLYDSIALESRWDGEINEIVESSKDINKVMLEFECYGTDSQSIHITGKTLINPYLNDSTYVFE